MKTRVPTQGRVAKAMRQWSAWAAAALLGAGVALSLTIMLLGPGVVLLIAGAAVGVVGRLLAPLVPALYPHRRLACTSCVAANGVYAGTVAFRCDSCGDIVQTREAKEVPELVVNEAQPYVTARKMLIVFTALSFVAFFVETYLGHYLWLQLFLKKGTLSPAMIPLLFSPVAMVVALVAAWRMTPGTVSLFRWNMLISLAIGLAGTGYHVAARFTSVGSLLTVQVWLGDPPAFAPLAFALPAIMGLLATFGLSWRPEQPMEPARPVGVTHSGAASDARAG
ncbi:MAG: hypothetical protein Q8O40_00895 [Chloroflexota bacterium]|nr:hypothetical protein [Chloroflexota bacterium]